MNHKLNITIACLVLVIAGCTTYTIRLPQPAETKEAAMRRTLMPQRAAYVNPWKPIATNLTTRCITSSNITTKAVRVICPKPAVTNVAVLWNYSQPSADIRFIVESCTNLLRGWTVKGITTTNGLRVSTIGKQQEFFRVRASNTTSRLTSEFATR